MTIEQVEKIKQFQREYKNLYGEELCIDWPYMKNVPRRIYYRKYATNIPLVDPEKILKRCMKKHKASIEVIRDRTTRLHMHGHTKERLAVIEFSKNVLNSRCNVQEAANLINRDRSLLYYYASM